ncbi:MAG: DsbE family thiol:disulfide interchange protein [Gammaproteobacteria bacterium]
MMNLDKCIMAFFVILVVVMGYLMMSDRPKVVSVGRIGQEVPAFALYDLENKKEYTQDDLRGEWTLLNIWASWCAPCKLEHPVLLELAKQGYRIVGLDFKDVTNDAQAFLKQRGTPYAIVLSDKDGKLGFDLGVYGVPETILIDKDGVIRHRFAGMFTEAVFRKEFLPLMQEQK